MEHARGSSQHFSDTDKEATNYVVGARLAATQATAALAALKGTGGQASTLSSLGRGVACLRAEAWTLTKDSLELLFAATVASYFLPSTLPEVRGSGS